MTVSGHNAVAVTLDGAEFPVSGVEVEPPHKEPYGRVSQRIAIRGEHGYGLNDLNRLVNVTLTTTRRGWKFPVDRFVEYEPSDEVWARPLGFGQEGEVTSETNSRCAIVACDWDFVLLEVMAVQYVLQGLPHA